MGSYGFRIKVTGVPKTICQYHILMEETLKFQTQKKELIFFLNHEIMYFSSEVSLLVANISTRN